MPNGATSRRRQSLRASSANFVPWLAAALAELLIMGQSAGDIRDGITLDDIYLLMETVPSDKPAVIHDRWLQLMLPGIITS
jgi:hypothetical protein